MKKKKDPTPESKPDLKHDTMEFSAATDGEDKLDTDDATYEEEGITAEELEIIEGENPDDLASALNTVETDREADDDVLFDDDVTAEEDWNSDEDTDQEDQPRR